LTLYCALALAARLKVVARTAANRIRFSVFMLVFLNF
jgi:hypothetical protein